MKKSVCVIVGVGPGNGSAFASRFVKEGHTVALLARNLEFITQLAAELDDAHVFQCDVTCEVSVQKTFQQIRENLGEVDLLIYNAGSGIWGNVEEITEAVFEASWRVNTLGLLLAAQQVIPAMKQKKCGKIIVIGATASRRGGIKTAAFGPAKAAQRNLAESMAKYLGPFGIHIAVVIIDGIIDLPQTREWMADKPDSFFVKPTDVATTVFWLTEQSSSAWSFEVEVRPFGENW